MMTKDKTPDNLFPPPSEDLKVGDLVCLDLDLPRYEALLGIIIKIKPEQRFNPPPLNTLVWWCTGERSWCLGEKLIVISSKKRY